MKTSGDDEYDEVRMEGRSPSHPDAPYHLSDTVHRDPLLPQSNQCIQGNNGNAFHKQPFILGGPHSNRNHSVMTHDRGLRLEWGPKSLVLLIIYS